MKSTIPPFVINLERRAYDKQNLALALVSLGLSGVACGLGYHFGEVNSLVMGVEGLNILVQGVLGLRLIKLVKEHHEALSEEEAKLYINFQVGQLIRLVRFLFDESFDSLPEKQGAITSIEELRQYREQILQENQRNEVLREALTQCKEMLLLYADFFMSNEFDFRRERKEIAVLLDYLRQIYGVEFVQELHNKLRRKEWQLKGIEDALEEVIFTGTFPDPNFPPRLAVELHKRDPLIFGVPAGLAKSIDGETVNDPFPALNRFYREFGKIALPKKNNFFILGNVAKGVFDAALIVTLLRGTMIFPELDFYRYSPYKAQDMNYISIKPYTADTLKKKEAGCFNC